MISQKANLHNRFDFEIYDTETGETEYAKAENIVLNAMWPKLAQGFDYFANIGIGKGTGTLSPSRTTLFSYLAYKTASAVETIYDTGTTAHVTKKAVFSESDANDIWTEIGIMSSTTTSSFITHALITDSEGVPITINKTNTKIVTVYATIFAELVTPSAGHDYINYGAKNSMFKLLLGGVPPQGIYFTSLLTFDGKPSIIASGYATTLNWNVDAANKRLYTYLRRVAAASGNYPIRGICVFNNKSSARSDIAAGASLPLSGVFPGKNFTGVAIGSGDGSNEAFDFPLSFVKGNSETIYINGTPKTRGTDYTVHYGMKSTETMLLDMDDVDKNLASSYDTGMTNIEEIIQLPQPLGAEANVTKVELKNGNNNNCGGYEVSLSLDGTNWVSAGTKASGWFAGAIGTLTSFTAGAYKYIKIKLLKSTGLSVRYVKIFATPPTAKNIVFTTAPASGAAITADFAVEYIPKSSNFVLDVQAEIVFGEGA